MVAGLKIIKRDGSPEDFDQKKIAKVVAATGVTGEKAELVAQKVSAWVESQNHSKLTSLQLRDQVLIELEKVDKDAANLFRWYQKTKE